MPVVVKVEEGNSEGAGAYVVILLLVFLLSMEKRHCRSACILPLYVL